MQVILLERIEKLGQMGDVVTVKDGFARNYLVPHGKAMRATKANLAPSSSAAGCSSRRPTCSARRTRPRRPAKVDGRSGHDPAPGR